MSDLPTDVGSVGPGAQGGVASSEGLLPQLVKHLRQNRTVLREEWAEPACGSGGQDDCGDHSDVVVTARMSARWTRRKV